MLCKVKISPELVEEFLTVGNKYRAGTVVKGIPEGSRLIAVNWDGTVAVRDREGLNPIELIFKIEGKETKPEDIIVEIKEDT